MPSKSKTQFKYIMYLRNKYHTKDNTPESKKWIWDSEWTNVNYNKLPDKVDEFLTIVEYYAIKKL